MLSVGSANAVKPVVRFQAEPFDLSQVRLLDGPFKHACDLDIAYLKSLPPDRLLHNFRVNAGLPSSAEPLGGWEAPDCEVRGHFVGHYLSACAMGYRATGDEQLKAHADAVVAGMAECQARFPSGYLSAFPESFFDRLERREPVWVPWYTLHKIYQGLLDMYTLAGNRQALDVLKKACGWAKQRTDRLSDEHLQRVLDTEHGGINEFFANVYAVTGDRQYLALAQRFNHHAVLDPLARGEDRLTGLHANTQFPKVIGVARQYAFTGNEDYRRAAEFFWKVVTGERSYVTGGNSNGEVFSPKEELSRHISTTTTETCNTYNMLRLTRHLFMWNPATEYADYYERALYNHILASQHPISGGMSYYVPLKTGSSRAAKTPFGYSDPFNSFWCCTGTGVENHVKYGDSIYWHEGTSGLYVMLFIPSELRWETRGVSIKQITRFPDEPGTRLEFACRKPVRLAVHVRRPAWVGEGFELRVNGKPARLGLRKPGFVTVERTWSTGDTLTVALPMSVRVEAFRDNPRRFALLYGPIVLCTTTELGNGHAYALGEPAAVAATLRPVTDEPLAFEAPASVFRRSFGGNEGTIRFRPFFREYERPYVVYWDALSEADWNKLRDQYQAERARERDLEQRTVDKVLIGDASSESAHNLQGEKMGDGPFGDRHWRHAVDGGWFSYTLRVEPETPQDVILTFWGSDSGARTFDVIIDGRRVDTVTLANNAPERFFDRSYPLSPEQLRSKDRIVVKLQAHPGNFAGGLFGIRVVRVKQ